MKSAKPMIVKCAKCGKEIDLWNEKAEMFDVPIKVCAISHSLVVGRTVYFLCMECSRKYKVIEEYNGRPIIIRRDAKINLSDFF